MEEILDDIQQDIRCDRCKAKIKFKEDLREGFVYAGEEQKTSFLANYERYHVKTTPYPFTICRKCSERNRNISFGGVFGAIIVGIICLYLPFGYVSLTIGVILIGIPLTVLFDLSWSRNENVDDICLRQFSKKYPEYYERNKTSLFTRKGYEKMYPVAYVDTEKFMQDIKKRNEEILEQLERLSKEKGS